MLRAKSKNLKSKVWLHMQRAEDAGICNICKKSIPAKGGNTSNLAKHLAAAHDIRVLDCPVFKQPTTSASVSGSDCSDSGKSSSAQTPWTLTRKSLLPQEKRHRMTRVVTNYIVKDMKPLSTISSPHFRDMLKEFDDRWTAPNRDTLSDVLIPSWYQEEKAALMKELEETKYVALTSDGLTSAAMDHYLTFTAHYIHNWSLKSKVLKTKAVFVPQTGANVAVEIGDCLTEFGIEEKVRIMTTDNASNMTVAAGKANLLKLGCMAHTLNLAAQKVLLNRDVVSWKNKIRPIISWFRSINMGKVVLKEKQGVLGIPEHMLILDVKTRWNSTYFMVERFVEQYPALLSACRDERIKKSIETQRLERITDDDISKAEDFCEVMKNLVTCTEAMSSENQPTAGVIIPLLKKITQNWMKPDENDSAFRKILKHEITKDLNSRYQSEDVRHFLEEATLLDPRFKSKLGRSEDTEEAWQRLEAICVKEETEAATSASIVESMDMFQLDKENQPSPPRNKKSRGLAVIFDDDDDEETNLQSQTESLSLPVRVNQELNLYKESQSISSQDDPLVFWSNQTRKYPILSSVAQLYLCTQGSSVPSERVFSTAGDIICPERSRLQYDKADMLIFLKKNAD